MMMSVRTRRIAAIGLLCLLAACCSSLLERPATAPQQAAALTFAIAGEPARPANTGRALCLSLHAATHAFTACWTAAPAPPVSGTSRRPL